MSATTARSWLRLLPRAVFWIVAAFYTYGALVHILNIASLTGFAWPKAPLKWQILDIVYLVLDLVVVAGLIRGSWVGIAGFYLAATSQIALYTIFREWVLNAPAAFQPSSDDLAYLNGLVGFHVLTCIAMCAATVRLWKSLMMESHGRH